MKGVPVTSAINNQSTVYEFEVRRSINLIVNKKDLAYEIHLFNLVIESLNL